MEISKYHGNVQCYVWERYSMLCMLVTIIYINIKKNSYENRLNVRATYEWRVSKAKRPQQGPSMMATFSQLQHSVCFKTFIQLKSKAPTR